MELKNLRKLRLESNRLIALPVEIGALQNLQSLSCSINQLSDLPVELGLLENLKSLQLKPPEIGNLQNLESLELSQNQLTSLPGELSNLSNLKELNLSGNSLPVAVSKKIAEELPNCRIAYDDEADILEKQIEEELFNTDKFPPALQIVEILAQRLEADSLNEDLKIDLANACGTAAFFAVFARKPEMAVSLAERGLALNPDGEWVETNRALGYLYGENWEKAKAIYERFMDKRTGNSQGETYREVFLQDLDALEAQGVAHPDVKKARELLKN
jgi:Leucine-rich repeat (LRR) protein